MTSKNSICVKCKNLDTDCNSFAIEENGCIGLIAHCIYGGKNAGDRKTCKKFKEAYGTIVENRVNAFDKAGILMNGYNAMCAEEKPDDES